MLFRSGYIGWLADAARETGQPVVEVPGWKNRGHGPFRCKLEAVIGHHTATPDDVEGDYPSLEMVVHGRPDLPGPLCHYGLGRNGTIYVVAAGCAWHAGQSEFAGFRDLNRRALGIEAESSGTGQWTEAQLDAYPKLVAVALHRMRRGAERYVSHRSCATPPGRKDDPKGINDSWMRERASAYLADQPRKDRCSLRRRHDPRPT